MLKNYKLRSYKIAIDIQVTAVAWLLNKLQMILFMKLVTLPNLYKFIPMF